MTEVTSPQAQAAQIAEGIGEIESTAPRLLVAVAGPPGAGKSTVAAALVDLLNTSGTSAALVPMDGFHLDNVVLDARGLRDRKGAPETFNLAGFRTLLDRLKAGGEVVVPEFDRDLDAAIAGRQVVAQDVEVLVVEGNYLLLDAPGWRALARYWDMSAFLDVPLEVLEARLVSRWEGQGLSAEDARARAMGNDIPNARTVVAQRLSSDLVVR